ncbi:MAG: type II secretion system protein [Candidatus Omnitrophota bacterium]
MKKQNNKTNSKGFTIGELLVVFAVSAAIFLAFIPVIGYMNKRHLRAECEDNLKTIGVALYMYANKNDGEFPPSLKTLYEENYLSDKTTMNCPIKKSTGTIDDPDYFYVPGLSLKTSENQPMAYDKEDNHPDRDRNVLFLNGEIVWHE